MRFVGKSGEVCVVMLAVLLFTAGLSFAQQQGQPPSPPSASDMVSRMKQELNLTDEQVSQITPIIQDDVSQMQSLMNQGLDRDAAKSQIDTLHQSTELELSQYLTPDQLTQWKSRKHPPQQDSSSNMGPGSQTGQGS